MRLRKTGFTAVIGRRGAEAQNGRITSSAQRFFFLAAREICFHDMEAGIRGADAVL